MQSLEPLHKIRFKYIRKTNYSRVVKTIAYILELTALPHTDAQEYQLITDEYRHHLSYAVSEYLAGFLAEISDRFGQRYREENIVASPEAQ